MAKNKDKDFKPSIIRYSLKDLKVLDPVVKDQTVSIVYKHVQKFLGKIQTVLHDDIHESLLPIEYLYHEPTPEIPYHIFVTAGMSARPMEVPQEYSNLRFAELLIVLPSDWPCFGNSIVSLKKWLDDREASWPFHWLRGTARMPHLLGSWVGYGHSIPNGEAALPFANNTKLGCMLVIPPISLPQGLILLPISEQKTVVFYSLVAIYKDEMDFKLKYGVDALLEKFDEYKVNEILSIQRDSVIAI